MMRRVSQVWAEPKASDTRDLRRALGSFATGITVVATWATNGEFRAFTANSFSSVSLDPPLVLVCLGKSSPSLDLFANAETISISILEASQRSVSNAFASRDPAAKIAAEAHLVNDEVPYVAESTATLICTRHSTVDAGDHVILIGRVKKYRLGETQPLVFFRGGYVGIGPELSELENLEATMIIGGLLGHEGKVLLCRGPGELHWQIPSIKLTRGQRYDQALKKLFSKFGIDITTIVPYSIFHEADKHRMTMVFSLESRTTPIIGIQDDGTELALFRSNELPSSTMKSEMKWVLVKRYLRELAKGYFSIYFDSPDGGSTIGLSGQPRPWFE